MKIVTVVLFVLSLCIYAHVAAQEKTDVLVMINGEQKQGKVTGITPDVVKFKYAGEDLEYEFKKTEIAKIQFASGRVEVFGAPATAAAPVVSAEERKNKIAALPFQYATNDPSLSPDQMGHTVQVACVNSLRKNTSGLTVQDPTTTNALLAQHNIDAKSIAAVQPKDLALLLGVQYVVVGNVDVMSKGTSTTGTAVTTYKDKEKQERDGNDKNSKGSGTAVGTSSSTTTVQYDTTLDFAIYDDQGGTVYSQSRKAFGDYLDAYTSPLDYLIKRTPFGSKGKK